MREDAVIIENGTMLVAYHASPLSPMDDISYMGQTAKDAIVNDFSLCFEAEGNISRIFNVIKKNGRLQWGTDDKQLRSMARKYMDTVNPAQWPWS